MLASCTCVPVLAWLDTPTVVQYFKKLEQFQVGSDQVLLIFVQYTILLFINRDVKIKCDFYSINGISVIYIPIYYKKYMMDLLLRFQLIFHPGVTIAQSQWRRDTIRVAGFYFRQGKIFLLLVASRLI
jgi:hypothetical protein